MLDFALSKESRFSEDQKKEAKLYILSNLYVQQVFDAWAAMDLLCRVRELGLYDVVLLDSMHQLLAPYASPPPDKFGGSASVSANMVPSTLVAQTTFQPLAAQLYLLLRSLVAAGMTVLVTNVLEKDRAGGSTYNSTGGSTLSRGGNSGAPQWTALKLPIGTGSGGGNGADLFDIVLVLSSGEAHLQTETESSFLASKRHFVFC